MLLRKIATLAGMGAIVALSAGYVLETSALGPNDMENDAGSFALAPLSVGNPAAGLGIATAHPRLPEDGNRPISAARPFHRVVNVGDGDTLAKVLERAGVTRRDAQAAIAAFATQHNPRRIRKGQEITLNFAPHSPQDIEDAATAGAFIGFSLAPNYRQEIRINLDGSKNFTATKIEMRLLRQQVRAEGRIDSSLYIAGKKAKLPADTLAELIRAYSWDVDFQRDIRRGDTFRVMYEQVTNLDGQPVRGDTILYAVLTLSGKQRVIYRYDTDDTLTNYYDANGHSARKALMRTPIDGARLSSSFGRRRHPVLGYTKMHKGVDFAAPRGTPIFAAGDGTVTFAGRNGGYGNYVRIRHNDSYATAYAHMKNIGRGIRVGSRVNQGRVVGYVGSTGRSTGPHLHYEILRRGGQVNPLTVRMPSGRKLAGQELARFKKHRTAIDQRFALLPTARQLADATVTGR